MRIVWKDSAGFGRKPIKYRGFIAEGYGNGWIINVPGDNNIYKNHYCAQNAIDKYLGLEGRQVSKQRLEYGIEIVGKKNDGIA